MEIPAFGTQSPEQRRQILQPVCDEVAHHTKPKLRTFFFTALPDAVHGKQACMQHFGTLGLA